MDEQHISQIPSAAPSPNNASMPPQPSGSVAGLSPEQQVYVNNWSGSAVLLGPIIYFWANKQVLQGFLGFVPFYNIYLYFIGIFKGRRMSWDTGKWLSFEAFQARQKVLKTLGIVLAALYIILFGVLIAGSIMFGISLFKGPSNTVHAFADNIAAGKIEEAYSLTTGNFQKQTSLAEFKNFIESDSVLKNNPKASFNSYSMVNDTATLKGTISGGNNETEPVHIELAKVSGQWLINNFTLTTVGSAKNQPSAGGVDASTLAVEGQKLSADLGFTANSYTVAGPAVLRIDLSGDVEVSLLGGLVGELQENGVVINITKILDSAGADIYDRDSAFETNNFFTKVRLSKSNNPVIHLEGSRSVHVTGDSDDVQAITGEAVFNFPQDLQDVEFNSADIQNSVNKSGIYLSMEDGQIRLVYEGDLRDIVDLIIDDKNGNFYTPGSYSQQNNGYLIGLGAEKSEDIQKVTVITATSFQTQSFPFTLER